MKFTCPRCCKSFPRKGELKSHIYNKITCSVGKMGYNIDLKENEDIVLGKIDPLNYLKLSCDAIRHEEEMKEIKLSGDVIKFLEEMKKMKKEMKELKKENEEMKKENEELKKENEELKKEMCVNRDMFTGDHNTVNNIVNNIVINNYTEPNTDYILSKHCDAALKNGSLTDGCLQMARLIWFNTNHPENHCMYMSNKKDKSIKCVESGTENEYTFDYKFKAIMDVILEVFERTEKESDKAYDLNDIFENPNKPEYKSIYKEIENSLSKELYNKRGLVKETIKQFRLKRSVSKR